MSASRPALALVEVGSIARGHVVADAVVKKAPVTLLVCRATTPGKFLVLFAGEVGEVEEAFAAGVAAAGESLLDKLILPGAHADIVPAARGEASAVTGVAALGIVETTTVATTLGGADAAAKAADVRITDMQVARGIGGKGYFTVSGALGDVEAAVEAAVAAIGRAAVVATEIIARPHADFVSTLR